MALKFGIATSDRVVAVNSASLQLTAASVLTLMAWINPTTFTNNRTICSKNGGDGLGGPLLRLSGTTGNFSGNFNESIGNDFATTTGNPLQLNCWFCVAMTRDPADTQIIHLYFGNLAAPMREAVYAAGGTNGSGTSTSTTSFGIGNQILASPNLAFQGSIAMAVFYKKKLKLREMNKFNLNYPNLPSISDRCSGLWRLGTPPPAATQPDLSGNGNHGTITGAIMASNPPLRKRLEYQKMVPFVAKAQPQPWQMSGGMGALIVQ